MRFGHSSHSSRVGAFERVSVGGSTYLAGSRRRLHEKIGRGTVMTVWRQALLGIDTYGCTRNDLDCLIRRVVTALFCQAERAGALGVFGAAEARCPGLLRVRNA